MRVFVLEHVLKQNEMAKSLKPGGRGPHATDTCVSLAQPETSVIPTYSRIQLRLAQVLANPVPVHCDWGRCHVVFCNLEKGDNK